jgi:competence protein ComEC
MLIVLLVVSFYPPLAQLMAVVIQFVLKINGEVLRTIENMPYNSISGIYISKLEMITLYVMVFISLAFITYRSKWQMFLLLLLVVFFQTNALSTKLRISEQKILTIHSVKNHDVVSCIEGSKMYLIADSGFIEDKKSFKFSIEPYCLEKGIKQIIWCNWNNNYEFEHLKVVSKGGFQFFDTKMTIIKNKITKTIYSDFCLVKSIQKLDKNFHFINCKYMLYSKLKDNYNNYYLFKNKDLEARFTNEYLIYPLN